MIFKTFVGVLTLLVALVAAESLRGRRSLVRQLIHEARQTHAAASDDATEDLSEEYLQQIVEELDGNQSKPAAKKSAAKAAAQKPAAKSLAAKATPVKATIFDAHQALEDGDDERFSAILAARKFDVNDTYLRPDHDEKNTLAFVAAARGRLGPLKSLVSLASRRSVARATAGRRAFSTATTRPPTVDASENWPS